MNTIGQIERTTQNRIVKLFQEQLGYAYLGNWQDRDNNRNIEEKYLHAFLKKQGHDDNLISRAIFALHKTAGNQTGSLYEVNKAVYGELHYGLKIKLEVGENTQTIALIDWNNPENNHFAIAEEVTVLGPQETKRPDIVLYVNGIALGVIELKRSTVFVTEGIRQNLDNQQPRFIERFFTTQQLIMAGNDSEGLRYGVIGSQEQHYLTWKEDSLVENLLDRHILQVCNKARFLEIIHDFIVFDRGTKKICRHNQYFGVRAAQAHIKRREGGIIWHTQGSGKSLTMVWLARWIRINITDSRVLIITDRTELDEQIEKVFIGVKEEIIKTKSGTDLIEKLNAAQGRLLCSLIHKFGRKEEGEEVGDVDAYITDLTRKLPKNFKAKGDIYVFVDECHRTQSGKLHEALKAILPNALLIGFTGTPLLKTDKRKSIEIFGGYIHTYKFDEAVKDGVVLDLRYEARDIDQYITPQDKIDTWFELKTKGLTPLAKAQLKQRWGTLKKMLSSQSRLEMIVNDILMDMERCDRLKSGGGNAMLVAGSIYQACKFYELFLAHGFDKCAIITSYSPSPSDIRGEETGEGLTEKLRQYAIYNKMLNGQDAATFEKAVKKKFIDEPGQMKLLIVVDKLLTGFDAPSATYLYIDKNMQDHGLFQAICRVNRLDGEDKDYGYIVDYKDLFKSLERSIQDYTIGALSGYDTADIAGLLQNRLIGAREDLDHARESIKALCEPVELPKDQAAYFRYFSSKDHGDTAQLNDNESKRLAFYQLTVRLIRAYTNIANELEEAGYTVNEIAAVKEEVRFYEKLRDEIKIHSGDSIDLKSYEPAMRHLIDAYIRADESKRISAFEDLSLIELIVERGVEAVDALPEGIRNNQTAIAETIENNVRRLIIDETPINPRYYENMSALLEGLIEQRRQGVIEYQAYLARIVELTRQAKNPANSHSYPASMDSSTKRALYDNLGQDEILAAAIDSAVRHIKKDEWRGNKIKEKEVLFAIRTVLNDDTLADQVFTLVKNQYDY
jgi:type I restriction enzyme R subunit